MNERDALLETIFTTPEDDAPRLIYTDWLEEHDEVAYADFIRQQLQQGRGAEIPEKEQARVWESYVREIQADDSWASLLTLQSFQRGFPVNALNINVQQFRDYSRYWWPKFPVTEIICPLSPLTIGEFVRVPYLGRVRKLIVDGQDPHGLVIPRLAQCHYLKTLKALDLSMYTVGIEAAEALARSDVFEQLEELRLPYSMRPNREAGRLLRKRYGDICVF